MTTLICWGDLVPLTRTRGTHFSTPQSACASHPPFPHSKQAQRYLPEYDAAVTRSGPQTGQGVYMSDFLDRFDEPTPSTVCIEVAERLTPTERTTFASLWYFRITLRLVD